ncbi:MAG TPA: hypothetical protein VGQ41_27410 [Pyrinomonadaceae bacterium]|jgi:creatinine amidohydrolase/Fe(II)-dependent formamide hydrolase-like protein|nr:hypothetical protein [Pyrinomonadaceae bacterium]
MNQGIDIRGAANRHLCRSYKAQGFRDIILLGESCGNQASMKNVAEALNGRWDNEATHHT